MNSPVRKEVNRKPNEFDVLKDLMADQKAAAKNANHPINDQLKSSLLAEAAELERIKKQNIK